MQPGKGQTVSRSVRPDACVDDACVDCTTRRACPKRRFQLGVVPRNLYFSKPPAVGLPIQPTL